MKPVVLRLKNLLDWRQRYIRFLVDDNSEHKKGKGVNRNIFVTITHNKYKDAFLNNKCLINSMDWIQSKDHKIGTYEINKMSLPCVDDKIYIQNNGYDRLALGYWS